MIYKIEENGENYETGEDDQAHDDEVSLRLPRTWVSLRLQRYSGQSLYSTSVQVYIQRIIGGIANIKNNTTYLFSLAMEKTMSIRV